MITSNKTLFFSLSRYDLAHESLAAATAGMVSYIDLDLRCITFTIHLYDSSHHEPLCQALYTTAEAYFTKLLGRSPAVAHCGLLSSVDVNGSKFSGAERDLSKVHCHSCIFVPRDIAPPDVEQLIYLLQRVARGFNGVKPGREAISFKQFDRNSQPATLVDWIKYAQKEASRVDAGGTLCVTLPFDNRTALSGQARRKIERRQSQILSLLNGADQFKLYRSAKILPVRECQL